ncbi:bifunctional metallophosphatase/5'-nucleotidase [Lutimaribacter marinistellae]|uniref:Bifunctional metallophosphatase/5'-nucleotidase n=1 Tax=Lutimaribacter marinistellae TaxID=1820329 RepID=A0ABV7TMV7_9RHOB
MKQAFLGAAVAVCIGAGSAAADFTLTILHTNDFHARFEPISRFDSTCSAADNDEGVCFGGTARLITAIRDARARADHSILVDGGDQFQGTLFYTHYKGRMAAEMMNRLGYDAMTVGNHEFDDGPEVLRAFMDAVDFPVLMSNADVTQEPFLADAIQGSTVIEIGGHQIGLVGLTPANTHDLASPGPNVLFTDPVAALQGEVDLLTARGIDKIVVLSHSGYGLDQRIAAETHGVDVIVGGHTNTYLSNVAPDAVGPYPTVVNGVPIVQAYAYGKFLGELVVTFDDAGNVIRAEGEPLTMDAAVAEDKEILARIGDLSIPLDEIRARRVAEVAAPVEGNRDVCRQQECEMGNLVADAMLARVADQGVTIAITNAGGLRASFEEGEVTMGEVMTVLPFQNTLSTFEVTGATLLEALENGVSDVENGAGRFPQVAGMTFRWTPSVPEGDGRVTGVMVANGDGYEPIVPDKIYLVVTNNFVRRGGDGYAMFAGDDKNAYDYGPDLADVVAEYLAEQGRYQPYTDGRIQRD